MHGLVFAELKKFVETNYGTPAWYQLLDAAGLKSKIYMPNLPYPDQEISALVSQASLILKLDHNEILESFGNFMVPNLVNIFKHSIHASWKALDLIENVESVIHKAVRINNKGAEPPKLSINRISKTEVQIIYTSARKMEHLGVGILKGIGFHYNEKLRVAVRSLPIGSLITITKEN